MFFQDSEYVTVLQPLDREPREWQQEHRAGHCSYRRYRGRALPLTQFMQQISEMLLT